MTTQNYNTSNTVVQNIRDISFYKKIFKTPMQRPNTKEMVLL